MTTILKDSLTVHLCESEAALASSAAAHTASVLKEAVNARGSARVIIATGNSQLAFIQALAGHRDVRWDRVTVFHMDEYVGMTADHSASFRRWIKENVAPLGPERVHYIEGDADDAEAEAARYEALLREADLDLVCMGIGENGHIAFNEPFAADFEDPKWVRVITLDDRSISQQVDEGHFPDLATVPRNALSLTVPALLAPRVVQVVTPEARKAEAVRATLTDPISNACPATVLRIQPHAALWLEPESAAKVPSLTGDS